ncbi:MAG: hypothetical protein K8F91_02955, partial [Candidatus Obscuribacterales bacterium]|nr:hypothetical protein [Candidatus Obscuribacterales bacterium]
APDSVKSDPQYENKDGVIISGDTIIMLTDAIAAWTMRFPGKTNDRLLTLKNIKSPEEFEALVAQEREDRDEEGRPAMKNDDVTLFTIEISS